MSRALGEVLSEAELDELSEEILSAVDYDIYKGDLEEGVLLSTIYGILSGITFEENQNASD